MKNGWKSITTMMVTALVLAGCGAAGNTEQTSETAEAPAAETETAAEQAETPAAAGEASGELAPETADFTYLEEYQIKDVLGDGKEYAIYAPKGGLNNDGIFAYSNHGISFGALVYNCDSTEELQAVLDKQAGQTIEFWQEDLECSDFSVGEVLEKGDDRYLIFKAKNNDSFGTPYQKTKLMYMSVRDDGVGVLWDMEAMENGQDEETAALLDEVARCYDLDLSEFAMEDGTWAEQSAQALADRQDVYEPEEGDNVLEKAEGYQYLGRIVLTLDEEGNVTYPVLMPMGWDTEADESTASTMIHGVFMQVGGSYIDEAVNIQEKLQEEADGDMQAHSNPEMNHRDVQISEVMPLPGQEQGAFYILEYEMQDYGSEEYHKCARITWLVQVEEHYFVANRISLLGMDYDSKTNSLIKELETAYGFDLSEWYAKE